MAPKAKKKAVAKKITSKKAEEARKSELVQGEGSGRLAVLESLHVTGVLTSRMQSRDVRMEQVSIGLHGKELVQDAVMQINHGRRYGLIGANGSGKTSLLASIAARELPIPEHVDMWFVHQEAEPTKITALQSVIDVAAKEFERLEKVTQELMESDM